MKTVAFFNIKGGSGKTTSVTAIAHILANHGKRVLLVDVDPQASSTSMFSEENIYEEFYHGTERFEYSTKTLLMDIHMDIHDCIIHTRYENLDIVRADFSLIEAEREIVLDDSAPQQNRLRTHLDRINKEYDYCLIDCGANAGLININALVASDEVLIPTSADAYSLMNIKNTMEMIENVTEFNVRLTPIGILYTRWEEKKINELSLQLIAERYQELVLPIKIRKSKDCEETTYVRTPLLEYNRKSNAVYDYIKLAGYIAAPNRSVYLKKIEPLMQLEEEHKKLINKRNNLKGKSKGKNTKEIQSLTKQIKEFGREIDALRKNLIQ